MYTDSINLRISAHNSNDVVVNIDPSSSFSVLAKKYIQKARLSRTTEFNFILPNNKEVHSDCTFIKLKDENIASGNLLMVKMLNNNYSAEFNDDDMDRPILIPSLQASTGDASTQSITILEDKKHKIVIVEAEKSLNIEFHNSRDKKGHVISKISANSQLANKLQVGDCIIGLNDTDVTGLASKKLEAKLKKLANSRRVLSIIPSSSGVDCIDCIDTVDERKSPHETNPGPSPMIEAKDESNEESFPIISLARKYKYHVRPTCENSTYDEKLSAHTVIIGLSSTLSDETDIHIDAIDNARSDGIKEEDIEALIDDIRQSKAVNSQPLNKTLPAIHPLSSSNDDYARALKEEQYAIRDVYDQGKLVICSQVNGEEKISKYHLANPFDYGDFGLMNAISSQIIGQQHYFPYRLLCSELLSITSNTKASICMDNHASGHHFQSSAFHGNGHPHPIVEALQHRSLANSNFNNWNPNPNQGMDLLWHHNTNIGLPPPLWLRHLPAHRNMYGHISYFPKVEVYIARIGFGTIHARQAIFYQRCQWTPQVFMNHLQQLEGLPCILPGNDVTVPDMGSQAQAFEKQVHRELNTGAGIYETIRQASNGNIGLRRQEMEDYLVSVVNRHQHSE
jgi:hypothetical protein